MLNIISAHYEGESDANVNADAIANIAAVADNIGGGSDDTEWITRSLESITFPEGITEIGNFAFAGMDNLESIEIPNTVTRIGQGAFAYTELTDVVIPENVVSVGNGIFEYCSSLTSVTLLTNTKIIPARTFYCCTGITNFTIPPTIATIDNEAFEGSGITSLTSDNSLRISDRAFFETSLESVTLPHVKTIGNQCFADNWDLETVEIGSDILRIGEDAFENCDSLATITINKAEGSITGAPWGAPSSTQIIWTGE